MHSIINEINLRIFDTHNFFFPFYFLFILHHNFFLPLFVRKLLTGLFLVDYFLSWKINQPIIKPIIAKFLDRNRHFLNSNSLLKLFFSSFRCYCCRCCCSTVSDSIQQTYGIVQAFWFKSTNFKSYKNSIYLLPIFLRVAEVLLVSKLSLIDT